MGEKDILQKLVDECGSFTEILNKQGKAVSGAAVKVLKNTLDAYEIDYSLIYERNRGKYKKSDKNDIPIEEILVKNSTVSRKFLKERLLSLGLKKNKCECEGCTSGEVWNGKPLVMQLHHINGIRNDNRLENLIMLCPNCHSQTENYAGGQKKQKEKHCPICGKVIGSRSTYCGKCASQKNIKYKVKDRPQNEELLNLILNESFNSIGKRYGVSDKAVSKWCLKDGLPHTKAELKEYIKNIKK